MMPAVKSGANIFIEGPGITLVEDLAIDIGDIVFVEDMGGGVMRIKHSHNLYIRSGGTLRIGNPADYSEYHKLELYANTHNGIYFYNQHGGRLELYGNIEIDQEANGIFYTRAFFWGAVYCRGNMTYTPHLNNIYSNYWNWGSNTPSHFATDIWDVDYLLMTPRTSLGTYLVHHNEIGHNPPMMIKNLTIDGVPSGWTPGDSGAAAGIVCGRMGGQSQHAIVYDSCEIKHVTYAVKSLSTGWLPVFLNCTFKEQYYNHVSSVGHLSLPKLKSVIDYANVPWGVVGQWPAYFEGCTFDTPGQGGGIARDIFAEYGGWVLVKDCTFVDSDQNLLVNYHSIVMVWTGNTFGGTTAIAAVGLGVVDVRAIDLTVKDSVGNPLEDAVVSLVQKDNREKWEFHTGVDGKVETLPQLEGKLLAIYREQVDNVPNYEYWSHAFNGTYHVLTVAKEGYATQTTQVVMDQDRTLAVNLQPQSLQDTADAILARVRKLQDK